MTCDFQRDRLEVVSSLPIFYAFKNALAVKISSSCDNFATLIGMTWWFYPTLAWYAFVNEYLSYDRETARAQRF